MKKHLTDAAVQRIKPPKEGSVEVFDLGYPGLALRVGHGGSKSFEQFFRINGKLKRESLGRWPGVTLAAARESWRKTREAIATGEAPQRDGKSDAMLFELAIEQWLKRDQSQNKASSQYQAIRTVEAELLPAWKGKPIDKITKGDVIALLDGITDRGAAAMAHRTRAHVRRFFSWCCEFDLLALNPSDNLPRTNGVKSRDRVLTHQELVQIWGATDSTDPYHAATRMLLLTGLRREEISQLKWTELGDDFIRLPGERTKTGEPHTVPLAPAALKLLAAMPRMGEYVFTSTGKGPIQAWSQSKAKIDKASGVADWRIHDLRRSVSTGMNELGVAPHIVESVLGHKIGGVAGVYNHAKHEAAKRAALELWAAHILSLVR